MLKTGVATICFGAALVCSGCTNLNFNPTYLDDNKWEQATPISPPSEKTTNRFKHVVIIVLENESKTSNRSFIDELKDQNEHMPGSDKAKLLASGVGVAYFSNFHGLFHPSYSNYLAMVSGSQLESHYDRQQTYDHSTIADQLEDKNLVWANYAEGYPGSSSACDTEDKMGNYVRKHVPFLSFAKIRGQRCTDHIIPVNVSDQTDCKAANSEPCFQDGQRSARQWLSQVKDRAIPAYSLYIPNQIHNGHNTNSDAASEWLRGFLMTVFSDAGQALPKDMLVIVTFDESKAPLVADPEDTNKIDTFFIGEMIGDKEGDKLVTVGDDYNHFNVLRTIEENFDLGTAGKLDRLAKPINNVWK
jgi:hypothetical protein